jgi:KaiC/GvpD/RAD55 family RecA-like ATPase
MVNQSANNGVENLSNSERVVTGIPGLEEMLNGGFPKGRVVLLVGGPGTGKTIFSSQFLYNGVEKYNENGVYISLDESKHHYLKEMSAFGWNLEKLEKEKKWIFIDASPIRDIESNSKRGKIAIGRKDFSLSNLLENIHSACMEIGAKRIAIDPITSLVFQYPDIIQRREAILNLIQSLEKTATTSILTTELKSSGLERNVQLEEYLAHGVIILQTIQVGNSSTRVIQIEKMREVSIDPQVRPYRITKKGIEAFPKESVF